MVLELKLRTCEESVVSSTQRGRGFEQVQCLGYVLLVE